jgi:hypothetical protein
MAIPSLLNSFAGLAREAHAPRANFKLHDDENQDFSGTSFFLSLPGM